jgi:hypothetical protein
MSTERKSLQAWIDGLVAALDDDPWGTADRLRDVVAGYTARISLDDDTVVVSMPSRALVWEDGTDAPVDGEGSTTAAVVIAILDGRLEVTDAVARGLVQARGSPEAVLRMFHAVELILDASARVPALRRLADEFRRGAEDRAPDVSPEPWEQPPADELALLARLGLGGVR